MELNKKTFFFIVVILTFNTSVYSQGAWDIRYIPFDSLNTSFIGQEIRIDFRATEIDTLQGEVRIFDVRRLLSKRDSICLTIEGNKVLFIENWVLYPDHGLVREQNLVSVEKTKKGKEKTQITNMFLESINDSTLTIVIVLTSVNQKQKIVINKSDIKGILVKTSS